MSDPRWEKLADILVNWSVEVRPHERVMIAMHEVETFPLTVAVYRAAVKAGGLVQVQFFSDRLRRALLKFGNDEQIEWVPEIEEKGMEWADVYFGLRGAHNLCELADIPSDVLRRNQSAMGKISRLRWEKTRWVLMRVPNESFAQQSNTDIDTMMEMFFNSCFIDMDAGRKEWSRIAAILEKGDKLRLIGERTDLAFSVKGRKWLVGDGRISVPDGEIYTAPIESTVNGTIYYEFPGVLGGRVMKDIQLAWKDGRLAQALSSSNQDYLKAILSTDKGSSWIGEFGFGVNPAVDRYTTDILIDEKIGGTIHTAMGRPYPSCGGTYTSAIHWDIVKDTRTNSRIYLDDALIFENGKFLI